MIELIIEVVFLYVLRYPGALIRWMLYRGEKSYEVLLNDKNHNINTGVSLLVICLIPFIIFFIKKSQICFTFYDFALVAKD
jgi:hypothetical protein